VDLTTELIPETGYTKVANEVFARTDKPVAVLCNMASAIDHRDASFVRRAGMPILEGTTTGLAAFRHLFEYRDFRARAPVDRAPGSPTGVRDRWAGRLAAGTALTEPEGLALLADYGLQVARTETARNADQAASAAERIGWPVALKTAVPGISHKSEVRGVHVGVETPDQLVAAYSDLCDRLGPDVVVSEMASGHELALGIVFDEQFGPLVMVAAGGTLIEVLRDRVFALPPLDQGRAVAMLDRLSVRPLLGGVRGGQPASIDAVAGAIVRLAVLAEELGDHIQALDANPVVAGPKGCIAVDALVIPRVPN
jgi:acyl-CoA synthetase (NDP forming)